MDLGVFVYGMEGCTLSLIMIYVYVVVVKCNYFFVVMCDILINY